MKKIVFATALLMISASAHRPGTYSYEGVTVHVAGRLQVVVMRLSVRARLRLL